MAESRQSKQQLQKSLNKNASSMLASQQKQMEEESSDDDLFIKPVEPQQTEEMILQQGILPLFLTGATQKIFDIVVGNEPGNVSKTSPFVYLRKEDMLKDIQTRLSISDFKPAQQQINEYPEDTMLLHYDAEFKYGQNFYLVTTLKAKLLIERGPQSQTEEAATAKAPVVSKPWVSLGSHLEIEEETVVTNRPLITVQMSKRRKEFGQAAHFTDDFQDSFVADCLSYKPEVPDVMKLQNSVSVDAIPKVKPAFAQTPWNRIINSSTQTEAQTFDKEKLMEIVETDEIIASLDLMVRNIDMSLRFNQLLNIFTNDYDELGEEEIIVEESNHSSLLEYQSFTDMRFTKDRSVSCLDWYEPQKGIIAISCTKKITLDERIDQGPPIYPKSSLLVIWSFHDPINPQLVLEAPEDISCFKFHPTNANLIAGGCINGQIVLWDISEYEKTFRVDKKTDTKKKASDVSIVKWHLISSIDYSHKSPISDIIWVQEDEILTSGLDGWIMYWDTKKVETKFLSEVIGKPIFKIPVSSADNSYEFSVSKMCVRPEELMVVDDGKEQKSRKDRFSRFVCGSEEGDLLFVDMSGEKTVDEKANHVEFAINMHFGSVSDVQRSPFFPEIFFSVGGWSVHLWKEGVRAPIMSYSTTSSSLIAGCWSPTRPGVFYVTRADGKVDIWDLLDNCYEPINSQMVSSAGIGSVSVHQYQGKSLARNQYLSAGDDDGTLHVLEVPRNLCKPVKNEAAITMALFDMELKRLAYVQDRKKPAVQKGTEQATATKESEERAAVPGKTTPNPVDVFEKEYSEIEETLAPTFGINTETTVLAN